MLHVLALLSVVGGRAASPLVEGTIGTVWLNPSGLPKGTAAWRINKGVGTFFGNGSQWEHWNAAKESDLSLLKSSLGNHPNATAIIYFEAFLADAATWGPLPLARLQEVVNFFAVNGVQPILFLGDPEFYSGGTWQQTHDVVRNMTARSYLKNQITTILRAPNMTRNGVSLVQFTSVYWLGDSSRCLGGKPGQASCTQSQIAEYNTDLRSTVEAAGSYFMLHLDGPFWNGCTQPQCEGWDVAGYNPTSIIQSGASAVMAESWTQGTLVNGVESLISSGFDRRRLLLLNDVPNCDLDPRHPCSTGSVESDTATWFKWLDALQLSQTWGVWDFIDAGLNDVNDYGDVTADGKNLTTKGLLHAARAAGAAKLAKLARQPLIESKLVYKKD